MLARDALDIGLPGVVSWPRPRGRRGKLVYSEAYEQARMEWAMVVEHAVVTAGWQATKRARYRVTITVWRGGKRDIDRVATAVFDALQGGGALPDDCYVDRLSIDRFWDKDAEPCTKVTVERI